MFYVDFGRKKGFDMYTKLNVIASSIDILFVRTLKLISVKNIFYPHM